MHNSKKQHSDLPPPHPPPKKKNKPHTQQQPKNINENGRNGFQQPGPIASPQRQPTTTPTATTKHLFPILSSRPPLPASSAPPPPHHTPFRPPLLCEVLECGQQLPDKTSRSELQFVPGVQLGMLANINNAAPGRWLSARATTCVFRRLRPFCSLPQLPPYPLTPPPPTHTLLLSLPLPPSPSPPTESVLTSFFFSSRWRASWTSEVRLLVGEYDGEDALDLIHPYLPQ